MLYSPVLAGTNIDVGDEDRTSYGMPAKEGNALADSFAGKQQQGSSVPRGTQTIQLKAAQHNSGHTTAGSLADKLPTKFYVQMETVSLAVAESRWSFHLFQLEEQVLLGEYHCRRFHTCHDCHVQSDAC